MPMYNLLYYSKNFRKRTRSFWNYFPDMPKPGHDDEYDERKRIFYPIKNSESFNYKTKLVGSFDVVADAADSDVKVELEHITIVVPLKI